MKEDTFSIETKKIRKSLLLFSIIGFTVSQIGLSIGKISIFGSELHASRIDSLPFILSIIILYYLVYFSISSFHEYLRSDKKGKKELLDQLIEGKAYSSADIELKIETLEAQIREAQIRNGGDNSSSYAELTRYKRALQYIDRFESSPLKKLELNSLRIFGDLFLPIIIGIVVFIMLAFYTEIPKLDKSINTSTNSMQLFSDTTQTELDNVVSDSSKTVNNLKQKTIKSDTK